MSQKDADFPSYTNGPSAGPRPLDARVIAAIRIVIMAASLLVMLSITMLPPSSDMIAFMLRVLAAFFVAGLFQGAFLSMIWKLPLAKALIFIAPVKVLSVVATAVLFVSLLDIAAVYYFAPILIETIIIALIFRGYLARPIRIALLPVIIAITDALLLLM